MRRKRAMAPREQRVMVPGQKAVSPLAQTEAGRRMGALAPTRATMPPLEWTPGLAQQEQVRTRIAAANAGVLPVIRWAIPAAMAAAGAG